MVEKELEIAKDKARQEGKKEEMLDKIAQGRLNKFYQEVCLLEQAFVKDPKQTIQQYLHSSNKEQLLLVRELLLMRNNDINF